MGTPVGTVIEVRISGTLLLQRFITTYHYQTTQVSSLTNYVEEMERLLDVVTVQVGTSLLATYLQCIPENSTVDRVTAQAIRPVRQILVTQTQTLSGGRDMSQVSNLQSSVTTRTLLAGRKFVGGKRIPLGPVDVLNGELVLSLKTALQAHGDAIVDALVVPVNGGGGQYEPVIVHNIAFQNVPTRVQTVVVQPQARVIRRRTVGLGI